MKLMSAAAIAALSLAAFVPGTSAMAQTNAEYARTISVTGTGSAAGVPDQAMLDFAVVSTGKTAGDAMAANAAAMTKVRDALKALGIEPKDMQTADFNLNPEYQQDERGRYDNSTIAGYTARNSLRVRLKDVKKVGDTIDKAVAAGANNLNGLTFGFQDSSKMLAEARREAVRDARAVADLLTDEAGVEIGTVVTMSEYSNGPQPRPMMMRTERMSADVSTPIEAGESEISVTVNITYSLK
ncbi:SIMPL domain-containing protein [Parvularcula sp. LCG005]|uniref:SIMPL domain-containing protein n=1 Tax=Parvularcula sp. LCG005 TaxID=3078805 RepID=UPI00294267D7|nr:SIMPL domain-containing protein [Parvularcula sp. LCG005]WOI52651.1 SIMPL domain-containing protein [Parvularcula sp. LCG005]